MRPTFWELFPPRFPPFTGADYERLVADDSLRRRIYGPISNYPVGLVEDICRRETITSQEMTDLEALLTYEQHRPHHCGLTAPGEAQETKEQ